MMAPVSFDTFLKQWRSGGPARAEAAQTAGLSPESSIIRGPANTLIEVVPHPDTIAYDRAQEAEQRRVLADYDARAEREAQIKAKLRGVDKDNPPPAVELGVTVAGLSPARERLARFSAWLAREQAELATLRQGRENCHRQIGAPEAAQAEIAAQEAADKSDYFTWLRGGAAAAQVPSLEDYRIARLNERLAADTREAAAARSALPRLEAEIEEAERRCGILEKRQPQFVGAVLLEISSVARDRRERLTAKLAEALADELALGAVAGMVRNDLGWPFYEGSATFRAKLPLFRWPGHTKGAADENPEIIITTAMVEARTAPLREAAEALAADARAKVRLPGEKR